MEAWNQAIETLRRLSSIVKERMKCPNCKFVFKDPARILGGKKSKRTLTADQARAMVKAREAKRKK
jgi:hypothetical protein